MRGIRRPAQWERGLVRLLLALGSGLVCACGPGPEAVDGQAIAVTWAGRDESGALFAVGGYETLGDRGPEPTGEAGLLEIDPRSGALLDEWPLGGVGDVLGVSGDNLVTFDALADPTTISLIPLREERPAATATFDGGGGCSLTMGHGVLPGGLVVLPCANGGPATSSAVVRASLDGLEQVGVVPDGCWLGAVEGEELWCLAGDQHLRRYALSDLSVVGEVGGLPAIDAVWMPKSNLTHPDSDQVGLLSAVSQEPLAQTYQVYSIPSGEDATELSRVSVTDAGLGWCQDAWQVDASSTLVACQQGSALLGGDPLEVQEQADFPTMGSVVVPLGGGNLAAAASGVFILDDTLSIVGGYERRWQRNPLTGGYSLQERTDSSGHFLREKGWVRDSLGGFEARTSPSASR